MPLTDAHCHLQAPELAPHLEEIWPLLTQHAIHRLVVNGMSEADWPIVAQMARKHDCVFPSFGLHPWMVADRSERWLELLEEFLITHPGCGVGEFGLDQWVKGHNIADQRAVFRDQLALAVKYQRPASIHCIQAWGPLWEELTRNEIPRGGFLIHAYGGPSEMVAGFVKRGAYFSFSPYFLHQAKESKRAAFRIMPLDRVLIETDAPALWPPDEYNPHPLQHPSTGERINHPLNLQVALQGLAEVRQMPVDELSEIIEANADRWLSQGQNPQSPSSA